MAILRDIMGYFCKYYPENLLSKARLNKLVYLADWRSCIERDQQLSDIEWIFNHYGPYVDDIEKLALSESVFNINRTHNSYGERKDLISLKSEFNFGSLSDSDKNILNCVVESTKNLSWDEFIRLVYSTYPVMVSLRHDKLDLVELSKRYKEQQNNNISG